MRGSSQEELAVEGHHASEFVEEMIEYLRDHPNNITGLADRLGISRKEAQNLFRTYASHVQDAVDRALDLTEEYVILSGTGRGVPPSFKLSEAIAVLERLRPEVWAKSSPAKGGKKSKKTVRSISGSVLEQEAKQRFGRNGDEGIAVRGSVPKGEFHATDEQRGSNKGNRRASTNRNSHARRKPRGDV